MRSLPIYVVLSGGGLVLLSFQQVSKVATFGTLIRSNYVLFNVLILFSSTFKYCCRSRGEKLGENKDLVRLFGQGCASLSVGSYGKNFGIRKLWLYCSYLGIGISSSSQMGLGGTMVLCSPSPPFSMTFSLPSLVPLGLLSPSEPGQQHASKRLSTYR